MSNEKNALNIDVFNYFVMKRLSNGYGGQVITNTIFDDNIV